MPVSRAGAREPCCATSPPNSVACRRGTPRLLMSLRRRRRTSSQWTMPRGIPVRSVAHGNGSKASPPLSAPPVGIGMVRHHRRSWSSRSTQDDQRPIPTSGAAVVAPHGVLLPMHLQRQGAAGVTIDLARATVPGDPLVAVLPLPPSLGSLKANNGRSRARTSGVYGWGHSTLVP